jgi:predicted nucleotide-binding protein
MAPIPGRLRVPLRKSLGGHLSRSFINELFQTFDFSYPPTGGLGGSDFELVDRYLGDVDWNDAEQRTRVYLLVEGLLGPGQYRDDILSRGGAGELDGLRAGLEAMRMQEPVGEQLSAIPSSADTDTGASKLPSQQRVADPRKVMVVYGRNEPARRAMFDFLRALDLQPLEWGQLVQNAESAAPYVGQVLDHAFNVAQAIVILFTPDDQAYLRKKLRREDEDDHESTAMGQPRPNVLFEAGMAFGRNPQRTVLFVVGRIRPISDLSGRHMIRYVGKEQSLRDLARRLEQAGCPVNTQGDDWASTERFSEAYTVTQEDSLA